MTGLAAMYVGAVPIERLAPLELKLQMAASHHVELGIKPRFSARVVGAVSC